MRDLFFFLYYSLEMKPSVFTFHRAGKTHEHFPPIRSVYTVDGSDLGCERSCRDTLSTPLWRPPV